MRLVVRIVFVQKEPLSTFKNDVVLGEVEVVSDFNEAGKKLDCGEELSPGSGAQSDVITGLELGTRPYLIADLDEFWDEFLDVEEVFIHQIKPIQVAAHANPNSLAAAPMSFFPQSFLYSLIKVEVRRDYNLRLRMNPDLWESFRERALALDPTLHLTNEVNRVEEEML